MVELADRIRHGLQDGKIAGQGPHAGLVPGLPAGSMECIDMSKGLILTPGHFVAVNAHKIFPGCRGGCLLSRGPAPTDGTAICRDSSGFRVVKGVAVVRHREEIQIVRFRGFGIDFLHRSAAAGNCGMVMEQSEAELPAPIMGFPFLPGHDGIGIKHALYNDTRYFHISGDGFFRFQREGPVSVGQGFSVGASFHRDPQSFRRLLQRGFHHGQRAGSLLRHLLHRKCLSGDAGNQQNISLGGLLRQSQQYTAGIVLEYRPVLSQPNHCTPDGGTLHIRIHFRKLRDGRHHHLPRVRSFRHQCRRGLPALLPGFIGNGLHRCSLLLSLRSLWHCGFRGLRDRLN